MGYRVKHLTLSKGMQALVDDEDFVELSKHKWCALESPKGSGRYYAVRSTTKSKDGTSRTDGTRKQIKMHRVILGLTDPKVFVDHIDFNTLNNQRSNLRATNNRGNQSNLKGKAGGEFTSTYVGVSWYPRNQKWNSCIRIQGRNVNLGYFDTEYAAARAYQDALSGLVSHQDHGQESAEDYPNATHCPCAGLASIERQRDCASAGCRYCKVRKAGIQMKTRPCSYAECGQRRIHHERPEEMRPHRQIQVPDDLPDDRPCYCSVTCATMDGWMTLKYETPEEEKARQTAWLEQRSK